MWRYSSMIACDFFSTSSSVKAGLGRDGGGVGALSRLTEEKGKNTTWSSFFFMSFSLNHIFLYSTLFNSLFHTWDEVTTLVPTSSISASSVSASPIPASSVPTVCHAGDAAHRFSWRPAISSPPAALLRLSAEASLGDLVRFPSFAAIKSVKSIPVAVAPVPVAPTFAARTRPNGKRRHKEVILTHSINL